MTQKEPPQPRHGDPWRDILPRCHLQSDSPGFRELLQRHLDGEVELLDSDRTGPREAVLVDCRMTSSELAAARTRFPSLPLVGVIAAPDAGLIVEALAHSADGVIALTDPPKAWRECLHVVVGGGRWLGGPGLEISLEQKNADYDVAKSERHPGDVTMRTKLFVRSRVLDKFRP